MKDSKKYKNLREVVELSKEDFGVDGTEMYATLDSIDLKELQDLLEDYDYLKHITVLMEGRKYYKKYLKERRKEQPGLLYPDFDEVYQKYFEQKETISELERAITKLLGGK